MTSRHWIEASGVLVLVLLYLVLAATFANGQSIWVDETTQLSGLRLTIADQLTWLVGQSEVVLGVPPDRMPPLSYWLGTIWSAVFGISEVSMRWMGIVTVAFAAPALYLSGRLVGGVAGGFLMLGFVLLSGTAVQTAVTIRAYPLYFLFVSWAAFFYCLLVVRGDTKLRFAGLGIFLVAAGYTHFFGVVAASCVLFSLVVLRLWRGQPIRPLLMLAFFGAAALAGLAPFVVAALEVSTGESSNRGGVGAGLVDTARLAYRIVAHPAQMGGPWLTEFHLGAVAFLLVMGLGWVIVSGNPSRPVAIAMPLLFGFVSLLAASQVVQGFFVHAVHYNLWMVPFAALTLACALEPNSETCLSSVRLWVVRLAGAVVVGTTLAATILMARHAELYSNGPGDWMHTQRVSDWSETLIIHSADGPWGSLYFTLFYHSDGELEQWLIHEDGSLQRIGASGFEEVSSPNDSFGSYAVTLKAKSFSLNSPEIADLVLGRRTCVDLSTEKVGEGDYVFCAYFGVSITLLSTDF